MSETATGEAIVDRRDLEVLVRRSVGARPEELLHSPDVFRGLARLLDLESDRFEALATSEDRLLALLRSRCLYLAELALAGEVDFVSPIERPVGYDDEMLLRTLVIWLRSDPSGLVSRRKLIGELDGGMSAASVARKVEPFLAATAVDLLLRGGHRDFDRPAQPQVDNDGPVRPTWRRSAPGEYDEGASSRALGGVWKLILATALLSSVILLGPAVRALLSAGPVGEQAVSSQSRSTASRSDSLVEPDVGPSGDASRVRCGPVDLRNGRPIPSQVACSEGSLVVDGDRVVGWNAILSGWSVKGPIEAIGVYEEWADGTPHPNGMTVWTESGGLTADDWNNDLYQEIWIWAADGGELTIHEHGSRTGRSVVFRYRPGH